MNTLETTLNELFELGYTPEEIRNVIAEINERIDQHTNEETGDK